MLGARKRRQVAGEIASAARAKYGELRRRKIRPPLDQLVQSILWRHTSVRRGTRALRELKRTFVDWNEVRVSPIAEIARAVSSADWSCACAEHVRSVLWGLFAASNVVSLELVGEYPTSQARAFLQGLPGVPRDVADEVLLFSCQADLLPVSDSAARMCYRLGLIESERATLQNQKALMSLWEPDMFPAVALFFADNSDAVCAADEPRHKDCPVCSVCPKIGLVAVHDT